MSTKSNKHSKRKTERTIKIFLVIFVICFLGWLAARGVSAIAFDLGCENHIHLAKGSADFDVAAKEIGIATSYMEENNLTEGTVSIFFKDPRNNLSFFYNNLKEIQRQYLSFPKESTEIERNRFVERIQSSLSIVSSPRGISIYPHNKLYFWWGTISGVGAFIFTLWLADIYEKKHPW